MPSKFELQESRARSLVERLGFTAVNYREPIDNEGNADVVLNIQGWRIGVQVTQFAPPRESKKPELPDVRASLTESEEIITYIVKSISRKLRTLSSKFDENWILIFSDDIALDEVSSDGEVAPWLDTRALDRATQNTLSTHKYNRAFIYGKLGVERGTLYEWERGSGWTRQTRRAIVSALEEILLKPVPVLDHGFVRVIDYMGDDSAIVQAARVSYGHGTRRVSEDRGLIQYLMRHRHTTPFEMCEIKYHVKLPIFVARQWIRHRTASVNEYSARYSILDNEFYLPKQEHLAAQATTNRQGRGSVLDDNEAQRVLNLLRDDAERAYRDYVDLLNEDEAGNPADESRPGLARELARMNLSLNFYTQWYWKIDLHNLMHFLALRADPHAQYEIRAYAEVMLDTLARWVPLAYEAFLEYRMNAASISATGLKVIRQLLAGEPIDQKSSGLSPREWRELMAVLGRGT